MKPKFNYFLQLLFIACNCFGQEQNKNSQVKTASYHIQPVQLKTRWAKEVRPDNVLQEYPRPQMERKNWENLNGLWEYAITDSTIKFPNSYNGNILVPYPIESALSGVQRKIMPNQRLWYKKLLPSPALAANERLILNFGAVDWQATIFINKKEIFQHSNGYEMFSVDITDYLESGNNELLVKVFDPTDQGSNPHGKQVLNPANIYYTSTSGIWQTVWLEKVNITHISSIKSTPNIDKELLTLEITTANPQKGMRIETTIISNGKIISKSKASLLNGDPNSIFFINIPKPRLWSPDDPFLYNLSVKIFKNDNLLDEIDSYFGMRKVNIQKDEKGNDRIFINNKYTYNLGVLDQGFWPDGLYTAPTDEALEFDIKAIKAMGFNTIRKHIKIEPERWYYHADKIGILVWQDFVNPPHGLPVGSKDIFEKEVKETINQLHNHPCIVTWVIFNERWGVYDQERITKWVKNYDTTRIVNGHSGELLYVNNVLRQPSISPWIGSDMTDVHSYPEPRNAPGQPGKVRVVGEFGGVGVPVAGHQWDDLQGWGYIQIQANELKRKYESMIHSLEDLEHEGLSASIYTQPFDVEGEENGLLTYDREIIKIPINDIRNLNKNLVTQSKAFSLDSKFFIATNIDANDNDNRYDEMLTQYKNGMRDSAFLRRLSLMALRKKNQIDATRIGNEYVKLLTHPFSKDNLVFMSKITNTTRDTAFNIFNTNSQKINGILGTVYAEYKVKGIIEKEELEFYLNNNSVPSWDSIQEVLTSKYGDLGEELVLGKRMMYYLQVTHDWKNFGKYYMLYFKKAMKHPDYHTNNLSWAIFQYVDDPNILKYALEVMKYDIETWDQYLPQAYDTYANILHKLNNNDEAIQWEEKALKLKKGAPDEKIYAETLQKMKSGLPTWPQNN